MLHFAVEQAFDDLLSCWRAHEDLGRRAASERVPLIDRAASRFRLERARNRMHQLRLAVHPALDELEQFAENIWCESLETVVHLRRMDRTCVCGRVVSTR